MRIVLDLQSAQAPGYRDRGIGRYGLALALAIAAARRDHDVIIALNGAFSESVDYLTACFAGLLPVENIRVWNGLTPTAALDPANKWRLRASELVREEFLASLSPDIVLLTNLFQGFADESVLSIGRHRADGLTASICHDLVPFIYPDLYLRNHAFKVWNHARLDELRRCDLVLTSSESSRHEIVAHAGIAAEQVVSISGAIDRNLFTPEPAEPGREAEVRARYDLEKPFILYTGAEDPRKNIEGFIRAVALLPSDLIERFTSVVACRLPEEMVIELRQMMSEQGLARDSVVFTGFIPDDDLIDLYRSCYLFVFPSWHEGFGLPALEAMACGAPTIGANTTSLPEVIGWDEALFDPRDDAAIARSITRALTDASFYAALKVHARRQAETFSWSASAERALAGMEAAVTRRKHAASLQGSKPTWTRLSRLKLAFISPLPPVKSGIADYSAMLLPELARHYDIDLIVHQDESVTDLWALGSVPLRDIAWFERHSGQYDRILYQMGNSPAHEHMFDLMARIPGVVVLHDFYLSAVINYMDQHRGRPGLLDATLLRSHSWLAVKARHGETSIQQILYDYPCNLDVLRLADGVIVHSEHSRSLAAQWYGPEFPKDWTVIPLARKVVSTVDGESARQLLGVQPEEFLVCSFGGLDATKCNAELITAWCDSPLAAARSNVLVFVGEVPDNAFGQKLRRMARDSKAGGRVRFTGRVDDATYRRYLAAADVAVQLRTFSRGESSAAALDCLSYGIPTIVNTNGSMAELPPDTCLMLPDAFTTEALAKALAVLRKQTARRKTVGDSAAAHLRTRHRPGYCADLYADAIEAFARKGEAGRPGFMKRAVRLGPPGDWEDLLRLAERGAQHLPLAKSATRQLLVDVSDMVQGDRKTGIQRVVRSLLSELFSRTMDGFRIEPVYASETHGYLYARRFAAEFLGIGTVSLSDEPVETARGDIYLCLDWQPHVTILHRKWLEEIRFGGVSTYFMVYDILPVLRPEFFPVEMHQTFTRWLHVLSEASGILCISKTVADSVQRWMTLFAAPRYSPLYLGWSHLGADLPHTGDVARAIPEDRLARLTKAPVILMVGTVEPRKGHRQALAAFDRLWRDNVDVHLVIVGKAGFRADLNDELRRHPEIGRQLFWVQDATDDALVEIYEASTCLLAASEDEGFGLPLVEAARHGLPVLARDIPVFREIADTDVYFYNGNMPRALADGVKAVLSSKATTANKGAAARADRRVTWLTWAQCTDAMLARVVGGKWDTEITVAADPDLIGRFWATDFRFGSAVGERLGESVRSVGRPGHLLFGNYLTLRKGTYVIQIHGCVGFGGCVGALAEVVIQEGAIAVCKGRLRAHGSAGTVLTELRFSLDEDQPGVECRVEVDDRSDIQIDMVEVWRSHKTGILRAVNLDLLTSAFPEPRLYRYWASHPRMSSVQGERHDRRVYTTGREGYLLYGPYIGLNPGRYVATVFGALNPGGHLGAAFLDLSGMEGKFSVARSPLTISTTNREQLGQITFTLDRMVDNIEVRVWVDRESDLYITGIELRDVEAAEPAVVFEETARERRSDDASSLQPTRQKAKH